MLSPVVLFAAQHTYINISDPFLRKIPVAVPAFKLLTGQVGEDALAKEAETILVNGLEFTGYIAVQDRVSYIENPAVTGITRGRYQL